MSRKLSCKQLLRRGRTARCMGILLIASSIFVAAADDYLQYSVSGSYGQERAAAAAAGSYGQERAVGGYGQESAYAYGYAFSSDSIGAYTDGTFKTAERILDQMMAGPARKLLQTEITVPADSGSDSSSSNVELDIIPAEVPADHAWDAQTWDSLEQWHAKTNGADADTLATAAYGLVNGAYGMSESAPKYGGYQESGRPGGYGGYGAEGAYFDFRSGTVYQPESVQHQQEAGTPPIIKRSAAGKDGVHLATMQQQPLQVDPLTPLLGGVTRGRGLPLSTALPEKSMRGTFTGQLNLPSLNIASPLQYVAAAGSVGRRLLSIVYDGLLDSTVPKQMSHQEMSAMLRPKWFSRKLHMAIRA